ncbi:hypothetical protein KXD40_005186 [Peronospora effusa]|nr:hypothetical protein KXD40_005186 [Peronospora effusa]
MTDDTSMRSKQLELFDKMHVGMDHVLSKLLQDAPPLPDSLKLQTETQSLSSTWLQVTETFEKRKLMLQRRREKEKTKNKDKKREKDLISMKKKKEKIKEKIKEKDVQKSAVPKKMKNHSSYDSLRIIKSSSSDKMDTKSVEKKKMTIVTTSPLPQKLETVVAAGKERGTLNAHEKSILKKLRKLPLCGNVVHDTNKFRAMIKWMELDKGDNAAMSTGLTKLLEKLQLKTALEKKHKPKLSRKRSLETVGDTSQMQVKKSKPKDSTRDRKWRSKQSRSSVDENEGVCKSEREKENESSEGSSESDEAEFVPELHYNPPSPAKPHKSEEVQPLKRQKQQMVEEVKEKKTATQMTSKEQLAAVVAKIRADEAASVNETKYLSYEEKEQQLVKLGASPKSAIVVDDTEKEGDKKEEAQDEEAQDKEEASFGRIEEESTQSLEHDSSTDEDSGVFDLNEEDVFVVEAILCVKEGRVLMSAGGLRRHKESDLYLVKWEGYDELTWEPDENIPRRLIDMFRGRERAKRACQYQIKVAHERREVNNLTTQAREIIYMIQWINQDLPMWEARATLPIKTQVWLDKVLGAAPAKKRRDTKAAIC